MPKHFYLRKKCKSDDIFLAFLDFFFVDKTTVPFHMKFVMYALDTNIWICTMKNSVFKICFLPVLNLLFTTEANAPESQNSHAWTQG